MHIIKIEYYRKACDEKNLSPGTPFITLVLLRRAVLPELFHLRVCMGKIEEAVWVS